MANAYERNSSAGIEYIKQCAAHLKVKRHKNLTRAVAAVLLMAWCTLSTHQKLVVCFIFTVAYVAATRWCGAPRLFEQTAPEFPESEFSWYSGW